jgi:hypothetical protein
MTSPIQRILILHLGLHETCHDGASLGEDASLEEIAEQILYYHQDIKDCGGGENNHETLMEEAVQFLGLCTALYSLPLSLELSEIGNVTDAPFDESDQNDERIRRNSRTKAIYFEKSTLVFVPLEESSSFTTSNNTSSSILAVVQIARSRCPGNGAMSNMGNGCNPHAIRISIEKCHWLFCMLNGGGITQRLQQSTGTKDNSQQGTYGGMNDLFRILKEIQKNKVRLKGGVSQKNVETQRIQSQLDVLKDELQSLRRNLPIQAIRRDLDAHYKEYLSNFLIVVSRNGGAGRCLVEVMPVPIAQDSACHVLQLSPSFASPSTIEAMKQSTNQILKSHCPSTGDAVGLLGICTFHNGQLLHCASSPEITIDNTCANILMAFMASYKVKMTHHTASANGLSIRGMAGTLNNNDAADVNTQSTTNQDCKSMNRKSHFLSAPPSFMLSDGRESYNIELGGEKKQWIWAPRIHLPSFHGVMEYSTCANMVMFECLQFSFLIILNLPPPQNHGTKDIADIPMLTMKLEEELTQAVFLTENTDKGGSASMEWTNSPGQEIVLLDRGQHGLVLLQDPSTPFSRRDPKRNHPNQKHKQRRFLGFGSKTKESAVASSCQLLATNTLALAEWSALGLDCRHLLMARLPLDVCLAFDDMVNEMVRRKRNSQVEMCTCMPYGWIYGFGRGDKEVYMFFDNSIYVTVADVTSAARRIQEMFLASF